MTRSDGFHTRQKAPRLTTDESPPMMSTSSGPTVLLQTNWTMANDPPQTSTAGQTPRSPRQPLMTTTSHAGIRIETIGSWRPAIAPSVAAGRPVTAASVRIGVPMAPKATGAVLAMSVRDAASFGAKPSPISSAAEMATGVPNPAAPSMKAPNENAMSSAWMRRSEERRAIARFTVSKVPDSTVRL